MLRMESPIKGGESMKRIWIVNLVLIMVLSIAVIGHAKPRIYKWVKDKKVSSDDVLRRAQYTRVVPVAEAEAQSIIDRVLTEELYFALAAYHTTRHKQDAETTADSVLPEEVVRQVEYELVDEDYRFILQVKTKKYGNRTRVTAKAAPVYRLRDAEAEEARDGDDETGSSTVSVKIKAGHGGAVVMGPIIVAPMLGYPHEYGITPLPDAGKRAGEIVKSFMYFLDKQVKAAEVSQAPEAPAPVQEAASIQAGSAAVAAEPEGATEVEVEVNVQHKR
jgi:hypothetical protein